MDSQRVEVLHVADGDAVISYISDHLVLHLLPAQQRLLHEDLTAHGQGLQKTRDSREHRSSQTQH